MPYAPSPSNPHPAAFLEHSNRCPLDTYFSISSSKTKHELTSANSYPSPFSRYADKEAILFPLNASPSSSKIVIQQAASKPVVRKEIILSRMENGIHYSGGYYVNQSVNKSINQSINQSIIQSINQSINQSVTPSINRSKDKSFLVLACLGETSLY